MRVAYQLTRINAVKAISFTAIDNLKPHQFTKLNINKVTLKNMLWAVCILKNLINKVRTNSTC